MSDHPLHVGFCICQFPGKQNPTAHDLRSAGPEGRIGTEDDIVN